MSRVHTHTPMKESSKRSDKYDAPRGRVRDRHEKNSVAASIDTNWLYGDDRRSESPVMPGTTGTRASEPKRTATPPKALVAEADRQPKAEAGFGNQATLSLLRALLRVDRPSRSQPARAPAATQRILVTPKPLSATEDPPLPEPAQAQRASPGATLALPPIVPDGGAQPIDSRGGGMAAAEAIGRAARALRASVGNRSVLDLLHVSRAARGEDAPPIADPPSVLSRAVARRKSDGDATLGDVATAAIDSKDGGRPLDSQVRTRAQVHLGADLREVRVHTDPVAREASAAIGARAFAHGRDIFLGPGESATDVPLMAHELTHVVQQGAAGRRAPQRQQVEVGAPNTPAEQQADQVAAQVAGSAPPDRFITDEPTDVASQMQRDAFMAELKKQVLSTASDALGYFWSAAGCPYIERWFQQHAGDNAASLERTAARYSGVSAPKSARDYIPPICSRLKGSIEKWRDGGDVGAEAQAAGPLPAGDTSAIPTAPGQPGPQAKPNEHSADQTVRELGRGDPLDGGTAARMGAAFGADFRDVRVHTDARAATKAADLGARAFTLGHDIAFGSGAFRPGSLVGDAMIAHELAHVLQQRGAPAQAHRLSIATESSAAEADADRAAGSVLVRLWRGGKEAAGETGARVVPALTSGYRLQRCSTSDKSLPTSAKPGKFAGAKVGTWESIISGGLIPIQYVGEIKATRTLAATPYDTEGAAIAAVKTNGKAGAVTLEDGRYYAYETLQQFNYKETDSLNPMGESLTTFLVPKAVPGVLALISEEGIPLRPKRFDPNASGPQDLVGGADALKGSPDNPFQGYKDALAKGKDLDSVDDTTLVLAFTAAMKDTALLILNSSQQQVQQKQQTLSGGAKAVSADELKTLNTTAKQLADVDKLISDQQVIVEAYKPRPTLVADPSGMGLGAGLYTALHTDEYLAAERRIRELNQQRAIIAVNYPLLARVNPTDFIKLTDEQKLAQLNSEMPGILRDIQETRINVAEGELNLWAIHQVVDSTLAGLGIKSEAKRKVILDKQKEEANKKTVKEIVKAVFMIGLGLLATFVSGPLGVVFAAGAFGLSLYDAIEQTRQYGIQKAASDTNLDPAASLLPPDQAPGWGWLVVAWVGVGIDAAVVAKAVSSVAKAERAMAAAIEDLAAQNAERLGIPKEELASRLKLAAGQIDPAVQITEGARTVIARRLGTTIEIDGKLGKDVRILYTVDEAGRVRVVGMRCGEAASVADILAHEEVLGLMRRYEGLTGRVRELFDRMLSLNSSLKFQPGSAGWESWHELEKLPELIKLRTDRLGKGALTLEREAQLRAEVEFLDHELAYHQRVVDQGVEEAGRGFVAATGDSTLAAAKRGFPLQT